MLLRRLRPACGAAARRGGRAAALSVAAPGKYEVVIGLEVHVQVLSRTKLFSRASTSFAGEPNSCVSLVDAALPGTLPVVSRECVMQAVRLGAALGGDVRPYSLFERKHYFYVDMPQGYQITQQRFPAVVGGALSLGTEDGRAVRVTRVQLEQDSGKNVHDLHPQRTYVDLNRAGSALLEVVTEPDLRSAEEAASFVRRLQAIVRHLGVCNGNMEEGSLRCDVNVSLRRAGAPPGEMGERAEVKNLNSLRSLVAAVQYEERRQAAVLDAGGTVERETRGFDSRAGVTVHQRSKEDMLDYRFMPEPDMPPLRLTPAEIEAVRASVPELPDAIVARWRRDHGLSAYDAGVIVADPLAPAFFDALVGGAGAGVVEGAPPRAAKACANWLANELFGRLAAKSLELRESPVDAARLGELVDLVGAAAVSGKQGKALLDAMMGGDTRTPAEIAAANSWSMVSDEAVMRAAVDAVFERNAAEVQKYVQQREAGKRAKRVVGFLVGQVIREAAGGGGNPRVAARLVEARLEAVMNDRVT